MKSFKDNDSNFINVVYVVSYVVTLRISFVVISFLCLLIHCP